MSQRKFILDVLADFDSGNLPPTRSPLDPSIKLTASTTDLLSDPTPYRRLVEKLNFITNSRPDISFAIQHLSQCMHSPCYPHFKAAMHTLRFLKGTLTTGLLLSSSSDYSLQAYCDSDWASCVCTRQSVSGYLIFLGSSPISWKSKKQSTISLSSAEAEYRSIRRLTAELAWLTRLLHELEVPRLLPVPVKCDSQAAIHIAKNPVFHERTKHIEIDCHFVRSKLAEGLITLSHVPTYLQLADVLTKPLSGPSHSSNISKLGLLSVPPI